MLHRSGGLAKADHERQASHASRAGNEPLPLFPLDRLNRRPRVLVDVREAGPLRAHDPLVSGPDVGVTTKRSYVHVDRANRLRAIDDRDDAAAMRQGGNFSDGQAETRGADDVACENDPGPGGYRPLEPAEDRADVMIRRADRDEVHLDAGAPLQIEPAVRTDLVLDVSSQNAIASREIHPERETVHRGCRASSEEKFVGRAIEQARELLPCCVGGRVNSTVAVRHHHRIGLQLVPGLERPFKH